MIEAARAEEIATARNRFAVTFPNSLHRRQLYLSNPSNVLPSFPKKRDNNCRVVRRKGRVQAINKVKPRFKARQG